MSQVLLLYCKVACIYLMMSSQKVIVLSISFSLQLSLFSLYLLFNSIWTNGPRNRFFFTLSMGYEIYKIFIFLNLLSYFFQFKGSSSTIFSLFCSPPQLLILFLRLQCIFLFTLISFLLHKVIQDQIFIRFSHLSILFFILLWFLFLSYFLPFSIWISVMRNYFPRKLIMCGGKINRLTTLE